MNIETPKRSFKKERSHQAELELAAPIEAGRAAVRTKARAMTWQAGWRSSASNSPREARPATRR